RRRARIAAHASWANTADRTARTAAGTRAFLDRFERQVDPERVLPDQVRAVMAAHIRTAYMLQLAEKSRITGTSLVGVFGWRTRSIGLRSIACSSTSNHLKNCCSPLCSFNAVDADRVSTIHAWNASTCARVTWQGSAAAASASGSGEYSPRYRASCATAR